MSKTFLPYDPDQQLLLPAALQEWLPPDHLAYFISDIVDHLDLSEITARYGEAAGRPALQSQDDDQGAALRVLHRGVVLPENRQTAPRGHCLPGVGRQQHAGFPHRLRLSQGPSGGRCPALFLQVLALCQRVGLVKLGHVALDGTKVKASASKHKAMSYRRMKEKEAQLESEVAELLRRAQEVDEEEDRRYGRDRRGDELPEELSFREGRLRKIREAKAALEAEAQAEAEQAEAGGCNPPGVPDDKAQRNFTDAESRVMPGPGGRDFQQAYNCQAVVDDAHQVIVAARATNQPSEKNQGVPMMEQAIANAGVVPRELSADAGYYSAKAVDKLYALGVDPFIAPDKTRHGNVPPPAPRGTDTRQSLRQGPDAAEAADQAWPRALRSSQGDGGAGVRSNQAGPGIPAVPVAGPGEGQRGMVVDLHRTQPAEAVPLRGLVKHQKAPWQREANLHPRAGAS